METKKGFTLIELLVVIAIIALLSSVVLASLSTARAKSRDARRIADFSQIMIALEMYYDSNSYYPSSTCGWDQNCYNKSNIAAEWLALETQLKDYIPKLPVDPINTDNLKGPWVDPAEGEVPTSDFGPATFTYAYGNVGRNTYKATYDLVTRLETPNHPQSSGKNDTYWGAGVGGPNNRWNSYSPNLYDPSPN